MESSFVIQVMAAIQAGIQLDDVENGPKLSGIQSTLHVFILNRIEMVVIFTMFCYGCQPIRHLNIR